jgi:hypothetical protein
VLVFTYVKWCYSTFIITSLFGSFFLRQRSLLSVDVNGCFYIGNLNVHLLRKPFSSRPTRGTVSRAKFPSFLPTALTARSTHDARGTAWLPKHVPTVLRCHWPMISLLWFKFQSLYARKFHTLECNHAAERPFVLR